MKYDYGDPIRGICHEYVNIYETLKRMPWIKTELFAYDEVLRSEGRIRMNQKLLKTVQEYRPDICFFVLFTDEIEKTTLRFIAERTVSKTVNWFTDDHWRFDLYSKYWAPLFHWVVTTDARSLDKYHNIGYNNAILSQWGFNQYVSIPESGDYRHEVSFIGQVHSSRQLLINRLSAQGIHVECWGKGWNNGRIENDTMREKFVQSKINLNFTASSNAVNVKRLAKILFQRRCDDTYHLRSPLQSFNEIRSLLFERRQQIKGRNFEIPGCGGFLLTEYAEDIERYFIPDKEVVIYHSIEELVEKIEYYLHHDEEREMIRKAGQQRTLKEHTYEQRFKNIFVEMGLRPKTDEVGA